LRCSDIEALWDELRDGETPRPTTVVAHLRGCSDCQHLYRQFEGVAYCLGCLASVEPPPNLLPRILDHIKTLRRKYRSSVPDGLCTLPSPLGKLYIAFRPSGITYVALDRGQDEATVRDQIERRLRRPLRPTEPPAWVNDTVERFFHTWRADLERLDISELTPFEQAVLRKAAEIPPGEVRSYSWVAREAGHPQAARAVGQVMARNPLALFFPCHRVVDASGALGNYGYGLELKARILKMEGYTAR
jgi:O-6-methylguanine DNA methyltransferase